MITALKLIWAASNYKTYWWYQIWNTKLTVYINSLLTGTLLAIVLYHTDLLVLTKPHDDMYCMFMCDCVCLLACLSFLKCKHDISRMHVLTDLIFNMNKSYNYKKAVAFGEGNVRLWKTCKCYVFTSTVSQNRSLNLSMDLGTVLSTRTQLLQVQYSTLRTPTLLCFLKVI